MYIETLGLTAQSAVQELEILESRLRAENRKISFAALHHRAGELTHQALAALDALSPALHRATSCGGTMSQHGLADIGLFVVCDPDGDYGTAHAAFDADTGSAAQRATEQALANAGRDGEAPDLVWISITPGSEEDAIRGIEAVVGADVPIIGGSAADDDVSGKWEVGSSSQASTNGLVVSVLFCSTPLHFAYQNGYVPTAASGVVTRSEGRRVFEIDSLPATEVYHSWNGGDVPRATGGDSENILSKATLWPLGRKIGALADVPYYLLAHPCAANPDGSIDLFAEVAEGETLTQMQGDRAALAARAGRVAEFALKAGDKGAADIAGALMVYCGGCRLAVEDRLEEVYTGVNTALDTTPFLGVFTFGEQGPVHDAGNRHGNLMISCIAFSKDP